MTYSVDFRKKVVMFVKDGGSQAEAARRFEISLWCVRDWLSRPELHAQQKGVPRRRKLDKERLLHTYGIIRMRWYGSVRPTLGCTTTPCGSPCKP